MCEVGRKRVRVVVYGEGALVGNRSKRLSMCVFVQSFVREDGQSSRSQCLLIVRRGQPDFLEAPEDVSPFDPKRFGSNGPSGGPRCLTSGGVVNTLRVVGMTRESLTPPAYQCESLGSNESWFELSVKLPVEGS